MNKKVALITAASQGLGKACAFEFANQGYDCVLFARSEAVNDAAQSIKGTAVRGDIRKSSDLESFVQTAVSKFGRIDALIVNTGHPAKGKLLDLTDEDWLDGYDLILRSVIRLTKKVIPVMRQHGGGAIVAISSLWAVEPHLDAPVSSVLRAGLSAFAKLVSDQYAPDRIRMNCLLPGFMDTYPVKDEFMKKIPAGRSATAEEVAKIAAFLASPESDYITGQSIRADGGLTRSL